ncbi:L-alanine-DL-glutamate epimerase-like enolase superfamily enzyme [Mycobacterium frederiksbergense]|uniref:L-alanine-DL-glutamate epimerase-like enolase superfamily enzyme n=1 Tax=Mycolicibacterium frederiksbergense TaxID=117567 RepID=A0ABT6KVK8_9MYCO|nr:mandelate racemase/muconate lactonizing enzyme family protein [Mycolicibacterium frederiksbergense]MDH6194721.1 L-alanine-DL-glutamate epimerase-like enolase superfamily enzyme [Mycolicibacterium frederiksbergense]
MKIDSVDLFYLRMPEVLDIGDGSQDMLLVRVAADGNIGWGECEASPLTSIASFVTPLSHSACHPVADSVIGERLDSVADIGRISAKVRACSLDLLQAEHTLSGIEIALWDLLGRAQQRPVWHLLGYQRSYPKTPYASSLFGDDPQQTLEKAAAVRKLGYRAAKFGWGPYGTSTAAADADQVHAAREGLGDEGVLLVDAGTVFGEDVEAAALRLPALEQARVTWLEEPFISGALATYKALADRSSTVRMAGGEGAHNALMAEHLIDYGGIGFVQIDTGRIGGIGDALRVARHASTAGVTFVNHTFTSHLALSASLQPFAGMESDVLCEYPVEAKSLAREVSTDHLELDENGCVAAPDAPGLGLDINLDALQKYLVDVEITVAGRTLYKTPQLRA